MAQSSFSRPRTTILFCTCFALPTARACMGTMSTRPRDQAPVHVRLPAYTETRSWKMDTRICEGSISSRDRCGGSGPATALPCALRCALPQVIAIGWPRCVCVNIRNHFDTIIQWILIPFVCSEISFEQDVGRRCVFWAHDHAESILWVC